MNPAMLLAKARATTAAAIKAGIVNGPADGSESAMADAAAAFGRSAEACGGLAEGLAAVPDPPLDTELVAASSGQRVATAAVAVAGEGIAGHAVLAGAFAGGLTAGLSSRLVRARSSAWASVTDGLAGGEDGACGVLCGAACDNPLPSVRRYQQLRLLA
jgi:hypothetical protein